MIGIEGEKSVFTHIKAGGLNDFFTELQNRPQNGIYFYRINGYNEQIENFIRKYYDSALKNGIVIEGHIPNPDNNMLGYYNEMMGADFSIDREFISRALKKWLPRMNFNQNGEVSSAIYDTLCSLKENGKNESMLKNAYIKFMCWFYYKFERIVSRLGGNNIPKLLYEGNVSNYELLMLRILACSGCDVLILQYGGDKEYLRSDPQSEFSYSLVLPDMRDFPKDFSLGKIREENEKKISRQMILGDMPGISACTNAWIKGKGFEDLLTPTAQRGNDPSLFYNCYIRINGTEDKISYLNELYRYQLEVKNRERKIVIVEGELPLPSYDEIAKIRKGNYKSVERLIADMASNIRYQNKAELRKLIVYAFADIISEYSEKAGMNLNRLTSKAVYILCWLRRYGEVLFKGWRMPDTASFVYLGGCRNENEVMFIKLLSRLPVDVLILVPDKSKKCILEDKLLYEINYKESLVVKKYPQDPSELRLGTAAYHAERELDSILYEDSGIYRDRQYGRADSVIMQTMYEEIYILWKQEMKYRPNFKVIDDTVTVPVIFSKICGVKDKNLGAYWADIKQLFTQDTLIYNRFPIIKAGAHNPLKSVAAEFLKNGRLQRNVIKKHKLYKYGFLREEVQEHILDKIQLMINKRIIRGTFESGTEYMIAATVLNLDKSVIRLIQKFDFTKSNPKVICLSLDEEGMTLEDTVFLTFLSLVGFDIAVFVPTGYQTIERYYNDGKAMFDEHQVGEYMYDLKAPDFSMIRDKDDVKIPWYEKIFKRGR